MFNTIKDQINNIRRHWKLFTFTLILLFLCYRMFISNYMIVNPIVKKANYISQIDLQNDLAICSTDLDQALKDKHTAIMAGNEDLQ